jgi:hypothetical protein
VEEAEMDRFTLAQAAFRVMEIKGEAAKSRRVHGLVSARRAAAKARSSERREVADAAYCPPRVAIYKSGL